MIVRTIAEIAEDMLANVDDNSDFMTLAGAALIVAEARGESEQPGESSWHDREYYSKKKLATRTILGLQSA